MLEKAVMVKEAVLVMPTQISNKDDDKDALPNWGAHDSEAWVILSQIVELFVPTLTAIKHLEGQFYITQSLILLELCVIEKGIKNLMEKCMHPYLSISFIVIIFSHIRSRKGQQTISCSCERFG